MLMQGLYLALIILMAQWGKLKPGEKLPPGVELLPTKTLSITESNYEIVIRVNTHWHSLRSSTDETTVRLDFEIRNKSGDLITFDATKVFVADGDGNQFQPDSPFMKSVDKHIDEQLSNFERNQRHQMIKDRDAAWDAEVQIAPGAKGSPNSEILRYRQGTIPKSVTISVFGFRLGNEQIKIVREVFLRDTP